MLRACPQGRRSTGADRARAVLLRVLLGGEDGETLFMLVAEWRGVEHMEAMFRSRTGQVLTTPAPAPATGRKGTLIYRCLVEWLKGCRGHSLTAAPIRSSRLGPGGARGHRWLLFERRAQAIAELVRVAGRLDSPPSWPRTAWSPGSTPHAGPAGGRGGRPRSPIRRRSQRRSPPAPPRPSTPRRPGAACGASVTWSTSSPTWSTAGDCSPPASTASWFGEALSKSAVRKHNAPTVAWEERDGNFGGEERRPLLPLTGRPREVGWGGWI